MFRRIVLKVNLVDRVSLCILFVVRSVYNLYFLIGIILCEIWGVMKQKILLHLIDDLISHF